MGVVIESEVWEPNQTSYMFIFVCCIFSVFLYPLFAKNESSSSPLDHGSSPAFLRFQRYFLAVYSLASVMEGVWSVFGEYELAHEGVSREHMMLSLCVGIAVALPLGTFLGMLSDMVGQKKMCLLYCFLHLIVGVWKRITLHPSVWIASICLSTATSIFSFSFETWMVVEHEKKGHRGDSLNDTFWLMTLFESASLIGSQVLANSLLGSDVKNSVVSLSTVVKFLALATICCIGKGWREGSQELSIKDYRISFSAYIFGDKRIWLLVTAQGCLHFSIAVFWILWASILVADGRELHLGLIYPCLMGARMLGSTLYPWLIAGPSSFRTEDCLVYIFAIMGIILTVIAYDYQEIGFLVTLFCLFNACVGLILPSLARLRTMYVPNQLRGGMIGLSSVPANAALLPFLVQGGYYRNISNSTILAFAALGLFSAAACMHLLKQWGKQPYQNWHKL